MTGNRPRSAARRPALARLPPPRPLLRISRSPRPSKKWVVSAPGWGTVHFGARGYSDYTIHRDAARKARYIVRHRGRERWGLAGVRTPGFWARWVLWNKPTLRGSVRDLCRRFPSLHISL